MYAHELYEQSKPRIVVTYPGRFQPFHQGHAGVFQQLQKKFGSDNVYIATSNDTSSPKSPFNFSDKYQLMTAAGVPGGRIIETNQMYKLPDAFDPTNTVFITAVGAPDADRLNPDTFTKRDQKDKQGNMIKPAGSPSYYKVWDSSQNPVTADRHGYVIVIPEIHKEITIKGKKFDVSHGTACRDLWNLVRNDDQSRKEFLTQMYARPSQELAAIFDKIPTAANEDVAPVSQDTISPISGGTVREEAAGVGVIANKKQANDPRYSMSLTKDVRPGQIEKSLRAFKLSESPEGVKTIITMIKDFLPLAKKELDLKKLPPIKLKKYINVRDQQATFGRYAPEEQVIYLGIADRHPVDILRTLAHEMVHAKQDQEGNLYPGAGETGTPIENEAHMVAGIIMRHFNNKFPAAIQSKPLSLGENVGTVRHQKKNEDYHPNATPPGPESKPTMPPGTVRVDVSDVYDWYKLGMHISNLKGLGHHDFGQGPPSTIFSFGSEDEEHKYIKDLEKTGLTTTDIDPKDPNPPKGMKRQKVDPTYNVGENFADGKNPQDKGDSARHGIPKKTTLYQLDQLGKGSGRKAQLARWQANMRRGKNK